MTFALLFAGLAGRAPVLLGILFARSLPFVLYATVTPRLSRLSRFAVPVAFAAVAAFAARTDRGVAATLLGVPFAAAYFAAGALLVHRLAASLPPLWIRRGAVLLGGAGLFVLGPAAVVRHAVAVPMIVFGWEMMLSAHSYAVDTKCAGVPGSLRDCLFFLLVDPTVVYHERGTALIAPGTKLAGAARVTWGAVTMLGRDAALAVAGTTALFAAGPLAPTLASSYARFCSTQALLLLGLYCAHSGLASVQIGWMRLIGYQVPERYRFPILARDPQDFWRRWNVWVSRWAGRYLYAPLARVVVKRWRGVGPILAPLATFAAVGLLHDLGAYAFDLQGRGVRVPSLRLTFVFVAFGLLVAVWGLVGRRAGTRPRSRGLAARRGALLAVRIAWVNLVLGMGWLVIPVLRTGRLPPLIETALAHLFRV